MENKKIKWKKLNSLICFCIILLVFPMQIVNATPNSGIDVEIQYPVSDTEVYFYKVADSTENGTYEIADKFESYVNKIQNLTQIKENLEQMSTTDKVELAVTLKICAITEKILYDYSVITGQEGMGVLEKPDEGIYLVFGDNFHKNGILYVSTPILLCIKNDDVTGVIQLDFSTKVTSSDVGKEYTVAKVWVDGDNKENRPENVEITLYKDGQPHEKISLNRENDWKYTWKDIESGSEWLVVENEIPEGYQVTYKMGEGCVAVENAYSPDDDNTPEDDFTPDKDRTPDNSKSPGGRLPQTGQLWWPVPFLAIAGIVFFVTGWIRRNREE